MPFRYLHSFLIVATIFAIAAPGHQLRAELTLTGAQIYSADGNENGAIARRNYRYTTNSADDGGFALSVNGDDSKTISAVLGMGNNVISFSGSVAPVDPGTYAGLNLFFTDTDSLTDNSFNPENASGIAGDLTVFTLVNSPSDSFSTVAAGIEVQTYDVGAVATAFANGLQSFSIGGKSVSVTEFTVANTPYNPSGSFTLTVVPEPISSLVFTVVGAIALLIRRRQLVTV